MPVVITDQYYVFICITIHALKETGTQKYRKCICTKNTTIRDTYDRFIKQNRYSFYFCFSFFFFKWHLNASSTREQKETHLSCLHICKILFQKVTFPPSKKPTRGAAKNEGANSHSFLSGAVALLQKAPYSPFNYNKLWKYPEIETTLRIKYEVARYQKCEKYTFSLLLRLTAVTLNFFKKK